MNKTVNIKERKPIWIALSRFYLDTELEDYDFRHIASKIIESPYCLTEVKEINKYEIFPILQYNLLGVAGVWSGFEEEWLINSIVESLSTRNSIKRVIIKTTFLVLKSMQNNYWNKLEQVYAEIKSSTI